MNRREFLVAGGAALPLLYGRPAIGRSAGGDSLALVTADKQGHVAAVALAGGRIRKRIATRDDPRSIEQRGNGPAVVAHSAEGVVSLIDADDLRVVAVLSGFSQPRYTAIAPDGETAYVTDSGTGELAVIDLRRRRVVRRVEIGAHARHLSCSPDGRRLWVSLGSSAAQIAVVDLDTHRRPVVRRRLRPPFLAHDVGFTPSGRRVWVTAGREPRLAVYAADGTLPLRTLVADAAPQHVSFGASSAFVASGNAARMTLHALSDGAVRRRTRIPLGAYNVQSGDGRVLTPSLNDGSLTMLDARGRVTARIDVGIAAHDACFVR